MLVIILRQADVLSSTPRPLADLRLRFLQSTRRGYVSPDDGFRPWREVPSFEMVLLSQITFFNWCIVVGGRIYAHFVSDFEEVKEEVGLTVRNPSCSRRM